MLRKLLAIWAAALIAWPTLAFAQLGPATVLRPPPLPAVAINGPVNSGTADTNGKTLIDAGGWSVKFLGGVVPATINTSPICFAAYNLGFDAQGRPTTYVDQQCITHNLRQKYPNQALSDATNASLARSAYSATQAAIPGWQTGISTLTSPAPLCNWTMAGRRFLDSSVSSLTVSATCFHRDGRTNQQVAGGQCQVNDGTNTNTVKVETTGINSFGVADQYSVEDFTATIPIKVSAGGAFDMAAGVALKVDCKFWPFVGATAADSSANTSTQTPGGSVQRQFSTRWYIRDDATRPGAAVAVICPAGGTYNTGYCNGVAGSDTTGQFDTTTPQNAHAFATLVGALNKITDATKGKPFTKMAGCPNGCADGVTIYVGCVGVVAAAGGQSTLAVPQLVGALRITRDPSCAQANANIQIGATLRSKLGNGTSLVTGGEGAIWFDDVKYSRGGNFQIGSASDNAISAQWTSASIDNGANTSSSLLVVNGGATIINTPVTNVGSSTLSDACSTNSETRMLRNVEVSGGPATTTISPWLLLAVKLDGSSAHLNQIAQNSGCSPSGSINYSVYLTWPTAAADSFAIGANNVDVNGYAVAQVILETNFSTAAQRIAGIAGDCDAGSSFTGTISNLMWIYSAFPSPGESSGGTLGRTNFGYNTCSNPPRSADAIHLAYRTHNLWDMRGSIIGLPFIKNDWFVGANNGDTTDAPNFIGGWPIVYGTDLSGDLIMYINAANGGYGGDRAPAYAGRFSLAGLTQTQTMTFDPLWVSPQYTTWNGAAYVTPASPGAGDYHLQAGSACKGAVKSPSLRYGMYGTARPAMNDSCGVDP